MIGFLHFSLRRFLKTPSLLGGCLGLGVVPETIKGAVEKPVYTLNPFVRIGEDDSVIVIVNHSEIGPGRLYQPSHAGCGRA